MIEVIKDGLYTSIQDLGRFGYRKYGVPISGAMDKQSAIFANQILGNKSNLAVMEITLSGPVLQFNSSIFISLTGAVFPVTANGKEVPMNKAILIHEGQKIFFGSCKSGMRAYLAIKGGFIVEEKLGSLSQYQNITTAHRVIKGDKFKTPITAINQKQRFAVIRPQNTNFLNEEIAISKGPEFDLLSESSKSILFNSSFNISNDSNRMGYRLTCEEKLSANEIITSPVQPGTVQLTPSGELIILMRDSQTTGGYARIFQLSESAINVVAQKRFGEKIRFHLTH